MKFTLDWLNQYINTQAYTPAQLADHLTMLGLEVDAVTELYTELAPLKVAEILTAEPHPDADRLQVCTVGVGEEKLQIVCGAPNARVGLKTAVALPGTRLPGDFKIKKSKVRGVESYGMLCSEKELGLSEAATGIIELPEDLPHGASFIEAFGLADIQVEVDLTPNRPDCASVIGVAREVASISKEAIEVPISNAKIETNATEFQIEVESSELCPRYAACLIKNVTIGPSPWWLQKRLLSVGLRPINNVVDITNFVMMEYGQPLHAFDFNTLKGSKIVVRTPRENETTFTTLDNSERKLDPDMLMICDGEQPVAVAGVMGGLNSEVNETTTDVLLESACFNDISIRKTARKLNLGTDASYRFERGVDPDGVLNAMHRAAELIAEIAGGHWNQGEGIDNYGGQKPLQTFTLRISRTNDLLGLELDREQVSELLTSIGFFCKPDDDDTLLVTSPSFRVDMEREADLIEEVARLIGYNNIPTSLPAVSLSYPEQEKGRMKRLDACDILTTIGYTEAINYSFSPEQHDEMMLLAKEDYRRSHVALLNPLSEDQSVMRTMLLPGLLENINRNISFQKNAVKLFEIGKIFIPQGDNEQPEEKTRLCGVLSGNLHTEASPLHYKPQMVDIYDAKGCVEHLLTELRLLATIEKEGITLSQPETPGDEPYIIPNQFITVINKEIPLGHIGKVQQDVLKNFGIKQDVFFFDLDFDALCSLSEAPKSFSSLPVYPSVKRDIALVVAESTSAGELLRVIRESREKLIEKTEIFDIYRGESIKEGYKSVALSITYRSPNKTLTEKNVEKAHSKIVKTLTAKFEGHFREA